MAKKAASWNVTQCNSWYAAAEVFMFTIKCGSVEKQRKNVSERCENLASSNWRELVERK